MKQNINRKQQQQEEHRSTTRMIPQIKRSGYREEEGSASSFTDVGSYCAAPPSFLLPPENRPPQPPAEAIEAGPKIHHRLVMVKPKNKR